jgi:putative DNA primase/helicase
MCNMQDALALVERGWPVLPLKPNSKRPAIKDWPNQATCDVERVKQWWTEMPGANVGIATGDGFVVIDLDVKNGVNGIATWEALCQEHSIECHTFTVTTPTGGRHLYFSVNGTEIRNSAGKLGPGIDVRGTGGYAVSPPSTTPDGAYTWQGGDMCSLPQAILDLLTKKKTDPPPGRPPGLASDRTRSPYVQAAVDAELEQVRRAPEGTRNDTLNNAAFALGQLVAAPWANLDRAAVEGELLAAAHACGLSTYEATATAQSGLDAGMQQPRPEPAGNWPPVAPTISPRPKPEPKQDQERDRDLSFLLFYGADDAGNAQCVLELYDRRFLYAPSHGWLSYNGKFWDRNLAEAELGKAIIHTLQKRRHAAVDAQREDIIRAAKPSAYHKTACKSILADLAAVDIGTFDRDLNLLNCQNGVIDLRTGKLEPHNAEQRFTYRIPVEYDPEAESQEWLDFLREAVDGQEMIDYLQMATGYSLTGYTREECLFYIYGPTRAGKGTFTETILHMLGKEPLATEADFGTFTRRRYQDAQNFDLAGLRSCRLVVASESAKYEELNTATIKAVTGGNEIRCAHKHKPFFSYRPQFKVWLVSNYPAKADVDDDPAWYRLRVIPFPHSHAGHEDKLLKQRLREPANLRGVLAWAVRGAILWYASGQGLVTPKSVQKATDKVHQKLDFVAQWLAECIERVNGDPDAFVPNDELYSSYRTWCEENEVEPKFPGGLTRALNDKGYKAGASKWDTHTQRTERGCIGVRFK